MRPLSILGRALKPLGAACACALIAATVAFARTEHAGVIGPSTRVHGMLVVQGSAERSEARLFSDYCDPVVLKPGRRTRQCRRIPQTTRLYVGYGLFAPEAKIERAWRDARWNVWIDGERVDLQAFGWADRTLTKYPPAGNKDVVLREWSVTLVRATAGRHTIRYRNHEFGGALDTTWTFVVRRA
jgi:hypothetical protein